MSFDEFSLQLTVERSGGAFRVKVYTTCSNRDDLVRLSDGNSTYMGRIDTAEQMEGGVSLDERAILPIAYQLATEAFNTLVKRHAAGLERLRASVAEREAEISAAAEAAKKQNSHLV